MSGQGSPTDEFDRVFGIVEGMMVDDIKQQVQDAMVEWGWAEDQGGRYALTPLGLKQLDETPRREVLVHFNVEVDATADDESAGRRAVDDIWFAARAGERETFNSMIALVDPQ